MSASRLGELIELAAQPSSERRREVLRDVTDLFMASTETVQIQGSHVFDGVMEALAADMEQAVRAELAQRLAPLPHAPEGMLRRLANDDIAVAEPVLRHAIALSEDDLLGVVRRHGQAHLRVVSSRADLTETISDVIVERGDDATLGVLLTNQTAPLSRRASEAVVDRAQANPELHAAVVGRESLPPDLLNEMYFVVESRLRQKISARNDRLDPAALEAALAAGRHRLARRDGALPSDYAEAEASIRRLVQQGKPIGPSLPMMMRAGERTRFLVGLAEVSQVEFTTVARIVERRELDALAILCKASDMERALFLTLAVLIDEPGKGMLKAEEYGRLYAELPKDMALRTLRFWRMRREGDLAA